jgi:phosphoribosylanthranilate isomerase
MKPIIKVCGMRDADNIREVEGLGIDLMGFICWEHSPRYVSEVPAFLPVSCKRVGVFVNPTLDYIQERCKAFGFNLIQLHGSESPDFCQETKALTGLRIIKAFNISTAEDLEQTRAYEGFADYFLFDTKGKSAGGNGEKFDWSILHSYKGNTPFLLSGGIGPEDARRLSKFHHDKCLGFDINSRFEKAPGIKDVEAIKQFLSYE